MVDLKEEMLPDGTWKVQATFLGDKIPDACWGRKDQSSKEQEKTLCSNTTKEVIMLHATELCGITPRIFACDYLGVESTAFEDRFFVSCYAKCCKEHCCSVKN